ncbi:50S ribosomal protein L4 [bacterium]|nr:50S ribosomal protein L4 [bacterium]
MQAVTVSTSKIFAGEVNEQLLSQALRVYRANLRQATARTKTRSEVNRTKKKWFKQKGTGNARHGAQTPALFVGGGVAHGPTGEQNYHRNLTTKMKLSALRSSLIAQLPNIFIEDKVASVDGKTKTGVKALADKLTADKRVLVIVDDKTPEIVRTYNNLEMVYVTTAERVNVLQTANADTIVMTKKALANLEKRLATAKEQ